MNIIKQTNKIEVLENGVIQVRELEQLVDDDNKVIKNLEFSRYVLTPCTDIESITCSKVKTIAEAIWTPTVVQEYKQVNFDTE